MSTAYLVGTLSGALTMPAAGRLIDRRGVRTATLVFGTGFGAVLCAMAGVAGFVTLALGFAGTRILGQGALTLTATTTVAIWFDDRRGMANGIKAAAGSGLMALVPIASAAVIAAVGWRTAWIVLGLAAWSIVLPLGLWLIRDPRRGDAGPDRPADDAGSGARIGTGPSWPVRDVVRHPAFLAMTGATALAALIGTGLMFHHIDLLTGQGLTTAEAAAAFLPLTVAGAIAALGASAVGPLIVSLGLDVFGSYTPVLDALGVVSLALAAATMFVQPPSGGPIADEQVSGRRRGAARRRRRPSPSRSRGAG